MTAFESASLAAQYAGVAIGIVQCALIWGGLRMMRRAADTRDRALEQQRRADDKRHAEAMAAIDKRHVEAMTALDKRRADDEERHAEAMASLDTSRADDKERHAEAMAALDKRHTEAMTALDKRHAEAMTTLHALIAGMEAAIERAARPDERMPSSS